MKVICVKDPNPDYQKWIFNSTGLEVERIPIFINIEYNAIGDKLVNRCWGFTQAYYYISELSGIGKIPSKYFKESYEIRKERINEVLNNSDEKDIE